MSAASAGGFFTTEPPGKPPPTLFLLRKFRLQMKRGGSHKEGWAEPPGCGAALQEDSGPSAVGAGPPCPGGGPAWWLQTRMPWKGRGTWGTNITLPRQWGAPGCGWGYVGGSLESLSGCSKQADGPSKF